MEIRNIKEADFLACVNIVRESWSEFKERESIYHLFAKYFSNTCFVCEHDGKVVAFLLGFLSQVDEITAYIHLVSTDVHFQRKGFAATLYRHFFDMARNEGRKKVCLIVNPDNIPSLEFHKKLGFQISNKGNLVKIGEVDAVKDYNGPGNHMVMFSRELTAS